MDFECFIEGAPPACVTFIVTGDEIFEGSEVFEVEILEDPEFPDAVVFHNELKLTIVDEGSKRWGCIVGLLTYLEVTLNNLPQSTFKINSTISR